MSELFNVNYPLLFPWKGKTFSQITSMIKSNGQVNPKLELSVKQLMRPIPQKLYRREIANPINMNVCYQRTSASIDEYDRPGGSMVYGNTPVDYALNGLAGTLDIRLTENTYERPDKCSSCDSSLGSGGCTTCTIGNGNGNTAMSLSQNALRRVRSGGMIQKKYNSVDNTPAYYADNAQYLKARNKKFENNGFHYLKNGDNKAKPGSAPAQNNVYTVNGIDGCDKTVLNGNTYGTSYYKPSNSKFAQQGGVSSSCRTVQKEYDTFTQSAATYRNTLGAEVADALTYKGMDAPMTYTMKTKLGFPNICTPVITPTGKKNETNFLKKIKNYN
jgi:hypothetical protein